MVASGSSQPPDEPGAPSDESPSALPVKGSRASSWLRYGAAILATLVATAALLDRDGSGFIEIVRHAHLAWVAAAFAMASAAVLLGTLRWQLVVEAMRYRLPYARALVVVLAAWPLALITPSRAGDFARALGVRDQVPLAAGTGSVLAEKVVDLAILLALAAAGAALESLRVWSVLIAGGLVVELAMVALLMVYREAFKRLPFVRRHTRKVDDLFLAFDALLHAPLRLCAACVVSALIRVLTLAITFALLRGLDADVGLFDTCALFPVAVLIGLVPVTLAGMGTRDATFMYLLSVRGHLVTRANVLAATMGYSAIAVGAFALIGAPFMVRESGRLLAKRR